MNYEKLRRHILNTSIAHPGGAIHYHLQNLATLNGLTKAHVEEVLLEMQELRLIRVSFDNGFAAVTMTARGSELAASLSKTPIGFQHVLSGGYI